MASEHACFAAWEEATADAESFHASLSVAEEALREIAAIQYSRLDCSNGEIHEHAFIAEAALASVSPTKDQA